MAILEAVFANKAGQTPQEVERRRRMAQALIESGAGGRPPSSGLELAGRLAMTLTGQYQAGKAERQDATNRASANTLLANTLLGTPGQTPTPGATGSAMPKVDAGGNIPATPVKPGGNPEVADYIRQASLARGIDPNYSLRVAGHEGLNVFDPSSPDHGGDEGSSFGPFQLHYAGRSKSMPNAGLGDEFTKATGLHASDPSTWKQQIDFSLDWARKHGWSPWMGAKAEGITGMMGIGSAPPQQSNAASPMQPQSASGEVASLDPSIGIPMPGAAGQMRASSPAQVAPQAGLPPLPTSSVGPAPAVASVPSVGIPAEFQNSPQLMNADPNKGIMQALLGGRPASPQQVAQAQQIGSQRQAMASQDDPRAKIAALLQNPYTQEAGQQMLMEEYGRQQDAKNLILKQQLEQNDPKYRQDLEKGNLELQNLREPKMSPAEQATDARDREKMAFEHEKFNAEVQKGQWQKMTDGRLYNQTTGEFKDAPPPAPGSVTPKFDDVSGMRKEIQQLPAYKNLAAAAPIYKSMAETAGRDSKASDLNLVYGLGKIMDPTSVVREGEMIMVKNTASLPDWLQGAISSLNGGAALTPETRQAIMTEAYGRVKGYNDEFQQNMGQYQGIVQRNGINPADVIPEVDKFEPWAPAAAPTGGANPSQGDEPPPEGMDPNIWKFVPPEDRKLWRK